MPLDSALVGERTTALTHDIDARWLMAYAAGIGDFNPRFMDSAAQPPIAHPVFPVCIEWPVILSTRHLAASRALSAEESARGVHAAHDLHLFRPIRAGDRLTTQATMVSARQIRPGAAYTLRLDTHDASGELVATTYQLGIYRGVQLEGPPSAIETQAETPQNPAFDPACSDVLAVAEGAAHTYTECARIWNPIHTDRAVALAAGLPDIILHGTATLALAVSQVVRRHADNDPTKVCRLGGRFAAMVLMPSSLTMESQRVGNVVFFRVLTDKGEPAINDGFVALTTRSTQ